MSESSLMAASRTDAIPTTNPMIRIVAISTSSIEMIKPRESRARQRTLRKIAEQLEKWFIVTSRRLGFGSSSARTRIQEGQKCENLIHCIQKVMQLCRTKMVKQSRTTRFLQQIRTQDAPMVTVSANSSRTDFLKFDPCTFCKIKWDEKCE